MEQPILEWIIQQVGLSGMAALALVFLNGVWKGRLADEVRHSASVQANNDRMIDALNNNTAALTKLIERLDN